MLEDRDYQEIFHMFKVIVESDIGPKLNKLAEGQQVLLETLAPRVYLKTPNAPGQRAFLRCAASFFLEIRQYSCEKMSCATQKSLAAGHIMSFQIHPKNRVEELEDEVSFLKSLIRMHSEQIAELKKKIGA
jgi:hypothetical protein